jgi:hypothetical protein
VSDVKVQEMLIEELFSYQDASKGDGKLMATQKEDVKEMIGRSPDHSDTFIMRMYFTLRDKMLPQQSEEAARALEAIEWQFNRNASRQKQNSSK